MARFFSIFVLIISLFGCEGSRQGETTFFETVENIDGGIDIPDNTDPEPEPPIEEPPKQTFSVVLETRKLIKNEIIDEYRYHVVPFRGKYVSTRNPEKRKLTEEKFEDCVQKEKKKCRKGSQIRFVLDVPQEYNNSKYQLVDISLQGEFYTFENKENNELLCLLNSYLCSGRAEGTYDQEAFEKWKHKKHDEYYKILRNGSFPEQFENGEYAKKISLAKALELSNSDFGQLMKEEESLYFLISDDILFNLPLVELVFEVNE